MMVIVPYKDAMRLRKGKVELQFAYVNENGDPDATDPVEYPVGALMKEDGYDPI